MALLIAATQCSCTVRGLVQLVVYVPGPRDFRMQRLATVARAAKTLADQLRIPLRGAFRRNDLYDISVYYMDDRGREEYVYSDWDQNLGEEEVRRAMLLLTPTLSSLLSRPETRRIYA
jgi:hypothetical protein